VKELEKEGRGLEKEVEVERLRVGLEQFLFGVLPPL
jgi:hypothetical protein